MENISEKKLFISFLYILKIKKLFAKKAWLQKKKKQKKKKNDFNYKYYSSLHHIFVLIVLIWCVRDLAGLGYVSYF